MFFPITTVERIFNGTPSIMSQYPAYIVPAFEPQEPAVKTRIQFIARPSVVIVTPVNPLRVTTVCISAHVLNSIYVTSTVLAPVPAEVSNTLLDESVSV